MPPLIQWRSACPIAIFSFSVFEFSYPPCPGSGKSDAAPLKTLEGTIKAEGNKIRFVNDGDQKSWDVMNPEALKGHEGHHVQVSAHAYADKNAVHVMSVKMLKASKDKSSM